MTAQQIQIDFARQARDKGIEEWRPVVGFEQYYEVSSYARVRSKDRVISIRGKKPYLLKGILMRLPISSKGYYRVSLEVGNVKRKFNVHRLLMTAFVPNPQNLPYINHIDGNKLNNSLDNLEWCSPSYNAKHAFAHGLRKGFPGTTNPMAVLSDDRIIEIMQFIKSHKHRMSYIKIGELCGVHGAYAQQLATGKRRKDLWSQVF